MNINSSTFVYQINFIVENEQRPRIPQYMYKIYRHFPGQFFLTEKFPSIYSLKLEYLLNMNM